MKQWIRILGVLALVGATPSAQAQYDRETQSSGISEQEFEAIVDLNRVRKGNFEWDTQQLIVNGFKVLHREHLALQEELKSLRKEIRDLEDQVKELAEGDK